MRQKIEGQFMKKVWFGSIGLALLSFAGSAQAADVNGAPVYKTPPPIAAAPSWTGFYLGAGVGLRASHADAATTSLEVNNVSQILTGSAISQPLDGTAFRASPYIGFNWQFAPQWVAGIEGDAGLGSQTTTLGGIPFSPGAQDTGGASNNFALKTTWDAGVRGRIGFLLNPATMAYVTGGAAWQHYEVISTCGICAPASAVANSITKMGWTVGGGLETALWGRWLARAEYRYADFGSAPFTITRLFGPDLIGDNFNVTMRTHTVTFGLAYKFN